MPYILRRLFSINYMLKEKQRTDDSLPKSSEVYRNAFKTAWPSALEAFLVGLIGLADTVMVGALGGEAGTRAVAAVGITGQPRMVLLCFIFSLNVGVTAVVARRRGEEDKKRANETLSQSLLLCFIIVTVMAVLGFVFAKDFMYLAGAKDDYIKDAVDYFRITMFGFVFSGLGMVMNAAQRGIGNTRISMHTNIIANVINLVFNFLLISGRFGFPRLEVSGAAIATVMGQFVMFVICLYKIIRGGNFLKLTFKPENFKFKMDTMKSVLNVGSSAFIEQLFLRIGFFLYVKFVADLGMVATSTHTMCMNILNMSFTFGDGLSIAASSLVGRSLGAKRPDIAIIYGKVAQRLALCVSTVLFFIFISGRYFFIDLFTDDTEIIKMGASLIIIIAFISPLQTSQVVISGSLRGAGDTKFVAISSFFSVTMVRPFTTWCLINVLQLGLIGAWYAILIDQVLRLVFNFARYSSGVWTKKKL